MIGYITLGSNDPKTHAAFYDAVLGALGAVRSHSTPKLAAWSFGPKRPQVMLTRPFDAGRATAGNGTMLALMARNRETVDEVHALALSLGASDEGAPGPRGSGFYAGYFRDPAGNKLNVFVLE
ncbi:VOC family protein [Maritimibacter dapengensis]|uniref:VOC family protein n=1 Tax=Maritimibacter dapengensis TaxID=2836868 RepID=A0ABS6SZ00_9RHOB|nr:VOC family protein [Maritimibacter dapengensis]MBV7378208.1 VOC family protein [Maritimibacter dapengensis]